MSQECRQQLTAAHLGSGRLLSLSSHPVLRRWRRLSTAPGGRPQVPRGGHGTGPYWVQLLCSVGLPSTAAHRCRGHGSFLDGGDQTCVAGHTGGRRQPPTPGGPPGTRTGVPQTVSVVAVRSRAQDIDGRLEGSGTPGEGVRGSLGSPACDGRVHGAGPDLLLCRRRCCPPRLGSLRCPNQPLSLWILDVPISQFPPADPSVT